MSALIPNKQTLRHLFSHVNYVQENFPTFPDNHDDYYDDDDDDDEVNDNHIFLMHFLCTKLKGFHC